MHVTIIGTEKDVAPATDASHLMCDFFVRRPHPVIQSGHESGRSSEKTAIHRQMQTMQIHVRHTSIHYGPHAVF
jgi:hypothetical protein